MRKHHDLKSQTKYFQQTEKGYKCFELRVNDRDFQVHETVTLQEVVGEVYTGRELGPYEICHVLSEHDGLSSGYCIIELEIKDEN